MSGHTDVLIVGAGPTGLVLALWLTAQNVNVRIIDKAEFSVTTSRAIVVQSRILELYQQLNLTDAVLQSGHAIPASNIWAAGHHKARIPLQDIGKGLTPYPFVFAYPQDRHEWLLEERLRDVGVGVERRVELAGFTQNEAGVSATLRRDGREETCEAAYIIGCDGGRSVVRHLMDVGFQGGTYPQVFFVADIEGSGHVFNGEVHINLTDEDFIMLIGLDGHRHARLVGVVSGDAAENADSLTFDDVAPRAADALKVNIDAANWFSTYRVHHRVADAFRKGRAFLVGDAGHVHSPAGGQGMNTGIGDAINLAWKLAASLRGQADDSLLDSYEIERRAFALKLVGSTDRIFTMATAEGVFANTMRRYVLPFFAPWAIRIPYMPAYYFKGMSQIALEYRSSPLADGAAGSVSGGDRLPWVVINGADNFASLVMAWQVHVYGTASDGLVRWCEQKGIPLQVFDWAPEYGNAGLVCDAAYLLRPDTYIGAIDSAGSPDTLERYFSSRGLVVS
ncbi:FAD binding monooxygenase [Aspergillus sp. HF37]|nr:FAD binding monooxygenase [Aspergillus sp. HF37]